MVAVFLTKKLPEPRAIHVRRTGVGVPLLGLQTPVGYSTRRGIADLRSFGEFLAIEELGRNVEFGILLW